MLIHRDYWRICRRSGFLAVVRFGSSPTPPPHTRQEAHRRHTGRLRKRNNLQMGKGEERLGGGGEGGHTTARKPDPLLIIQYSLHRSIHFQRLLCCSERYFLRFLFDGRTDSVSIQKIAAGYLGWRNAPKHGHIPIKTPNPKCRLYWCLSEFIDWRYSQSCWYFSTPLVN